MSTLGLRAAAALVAAVAAPSCGAPEAGRRGPAPIPRIAWCGVGVDVGRPGDGAAGSSPAILSPNVAVNMAGPEALVALGCCLAFWAASEAVRATRSDGSARIAGGAEIWELMRKEAADEFLRAMDEELSAQIRELAPPPPARPPPGTDVVVTAEIGPARAPSAGGIELLVRLRVRDREGREAFRHEAWTEPFPEPVAWGEAHAASVRRAVGPVADRLVRKYRLTLQ